MLAFFASFDCHECFMSYVADCRHQKEYHYCGEELIMSSKNMESSMLSPAVNSAEVYPNAPEMENEIDLIELFYYLVGKLKWIVLAGMICAAIAGIYAFAVQKPEYEATSRLYIDNTRNTLMDYLNLHNGKYSAKDYLEVLSTAQVQNATLQKLGLEYTDEEIKEMISVDNPAGSRVLTITVKSSIPEETSGIANEMALAAIRYATGAMVTDELRLLSEATVPAQPLKMGRMNKILTGALLGGFLAAGIFCARFVLSDYIRTPADITRCSGLPVLAVTASREQKRRRAL